MNEVVRLTPRDDERWDRYLAGRRPDPTELSAWRRIVEATYGIESHGFAVVRDGEWRGALLLYEVRHRLFGHYLVTVPFGNDGGLHFDDDDARDRLVAAARDLADGAGVEYLLIRGRGLELRQFEVDRRYSTAVIDLAADEQTAWESGFKNKTRNQIRRGQQGGFEIESGPQTLQPFHDVLQRHMRDLGSPVHGVGFYRAIQREFPDHCSFLVARKDGALAAGALLFHVGGVAMNLHTVAIRPYNRYGVNYLVYWEMIRRSIAAGCREFDLGRSVDPGPNLDFKKHWKPRVIPLTYNYYLRKLERPPFLDPRNRRYAMAIATWKRLPLWLTRRLGPPLIRGLV